MALVNRRTQKNIFALLAMIITIVLGTNTALHKQVPAANQTASPIASPLVWYPVKKVIDGDTIEIIVDRKIIKIRLIGLDTPEIVDPRRPVMCFGKEASNEAKKILTGQSVRIETDPSQDLYDKYGRLLAYVYAPANVTPEGILVNKYMISEGFGHEYTYDLPYKYQKEFRAAERTARENQKGLWAGGRCQN